MKKLILFAAILFAGVSVVKAQPEGTVIEAQNKQVTLKISLLPIQSLILNGSSEVSLVYKEKENYNEGVDVKVLDHLTVSSTGAFDITVTATEFELNGNTKATSDLLMASIKLNATSGTDYDLEDADALKSEVSLATSGSTLVNSTKGGFDQNISVEYVGGDSYRDFYQQGTTNMFTTTLTYSLVAK